MQTKILLIVIFSLLITIPLNSYSEYDSPYILVQVIVRDSNETLVAYLESDRVEIIHMDALQFILDIEASINDPIYEGGDGEKYQVITRQSIEIIKSQGQLSNTQLYMDIDGKQIPILRFPHDGIRTAPGDIIITVWHFARDVS